MINLGLRFVAFIKNNIIRTVYVRWNPGDITQTQIRSPDNENFRLFLWQEAFSYFSSLFVSCRGIHSLSLAIINLYQKLFVIKKLFFRHFGTNDLAWWSKIPRVDFSEARWERGQNAPGKKVELGSKLFNRIQTCNWALTSRSPRCGEPPEPEVWRPLVIIQTLSVGFFNSGESPIMECKQRTHGNTAFGIVENLYVLRSCHFAILKPTSSLEPVLQPANFRSPHPGIECAPPLFFRWKRTVSVGLKE